MGLVSEFKIDPTEKFLHLTQAPIVEAVIHFRAFAEKSLPPEELLEQLKGQLPDYPNAQKQQELSLESQIGPEGSAHTQRAHWHGFRFESEDKRHVAQFTRNGFVFSRLAPYEQWGSFEAEALRLWHIYFKLAGPSEIQRLGVRFINCIPSVEVDELDSVLAIPPKCGHDLDLPFEGFMYQSRFDIPGHPYKLNVIQTTQAPIPPNQKDSALIFDIDVFTTNVLVPDDKLLRERLTEMRWIKNKAFFTFLTKTAIARFQE